jgi:hypothetical protein
VNGYDEILKPEEVAALTGRSQRAYKFSGSMSIAGNFS